MLEVFLIDRKLKPVQEFSDRRKSNNISYDKYRAEIIDRD